MGQGASPYQGKQSQALACSSEECSHRTGGRLRAEGTAGGPTSCSSFAAGPAGRLDQVAFSLTQPELRCGGGVCLARALKLPVNSTQFCLKQNVKHGDGCRRVSGTLSLGWAEITALMGSGPVLLFLIHMKCSRKSLSCCQS